MSAWAFGGWEQRGGDHSRHHSGGGRLAGHGLLVTGLLVTGLLVTGLLVTGLTAALPATSLRRAPSAARWPWRNYLRSLMRRLRRRPPACPLSGRSLGVPRCRPRPAARPRRGRRSREARPIGTGAPADAGVSAAHGAVGAAAWAGRAGHTLTNGDGYHYRSTDHSGTGPGGQ